MKKLNLVTTLAALFLCTNAMADVTASATASWDASATKDTTSSLVVTPLKSLNFQYGEGSSAFSSQDGAFDITIQGQSGATDFELTSQVINNTLTRGNDPSTLNVGVAWNGTQLSKTAATTLLDTAANVTSGLDSLASAAAYAGNERSSALGKFTFTVDSATSDGSSVVKFEDLPDGYWSGDVKVQFNAVWSV